MSTAGSCTHHLGRDALCQGHTASARQSWAEASMWVAVPLSGKLVLLGHLASVLRLGNQWGRSWRYPRSLWRKEEAPSGCRTMSAEGVDSRLQKDLIPRAAALILVSNPSINGAWWRPTPGRLIPRGRGSFIRHYPCGTSCGVSWTISFCLHHIAVVTMIIPIILCTERKCNSKNWGSCWRLCALYTKP